MSNSTTQIPLLDELRIPVFRRMLLVWYQAHKRDLPWRESRDPYRVWLSEVMLQQTRVAAVIEHYREFLRLFPTIEKLAAARESKVLAAWSGLGYYRRARMLHAAAKVLVRERGGKFLRNAAGLRDLPGIGRYTAAAIASIAFGEAAAVVDGNVERVLRRLSGKQILGERAWEVAGQLLDPQHPGDFNQAMMELGATVCTPRTPLCQSCPVFDVCATTGELPGPRKSLPQKKREIRCALVRRGEKRQADSVLLVQRPRDASLMAGMWELPLITAKDNSSRPTFTLRHSITVTDYKVRVWQIFDDKPQQSGGKWISKSKLASMPLTGLARKILRRAEIL